MYAAGDDRYCYAGSTVLRNRLGIRRQAGYPFDLRRLAPDQFLAAMIASFHGDCRALERQIERLVQ
jgi:hypothetical protein